MRQSTARSKEKAPPKPLDAAKLEALALHYAARFATTQAKLEDYLRRKLRERGWAGEGPPPIAQITQRFAEAGYVDDAAFARTKTDSLMRRGYGLRRVSQALGAAGISEEDRAEITPGQAKQRAAALVFARKRRFGPFAADPPDRPAREKQFAAMLRAGHPLDSARELVNAVTVEAAEDWAAQGDGEDICD